MLNSIDGPDESLNEINISLIPVPCPASGRATVATTKTIHYLLT